MQHSESSDSAGMNSPDADWQIAVAEVEPGLADGAETFDSLVEAIENTTATIIADSKTLGFCRGRPCWDWL